MTYKDIILNLLKKRADIICLEKHLTDEFPDETNSSNQLERWLNENHIVATRLEDQDPVKLVLKKEACLLN